MVKAPCSARRPWGAGGAATAILGQMPMAIRNGGVGGFVMATAGIINGPDVAGTASVSRATARMSGAPAPTATDKQETKSRVASSTSVP